MEDFVKKIIEESFGEHLEIGMVTGNPEDPETLVKILDGQFYGEHGVSNFWYWQEMLPDGTLIGEVKSGYGWNPSKTRKYK